MVVGDKVTVGDRVICCAENEKLVVHWYCSDKKVYIKEYTCPPKATREYNRAIEDRKESHNASFDS